jgi:hypothetical protein
VAEKVEQMAVGTLDLSALVAGSSSEFTNRGIYGILSHPDRITKTDVTTPTGSNPNVTVADVLTMRDLAFAQNFYGPFVIYHSTDWDKYLDQDYYNITTSGAVSPSQTLRDRLRKIEGIQDIRRLDYLPSSSNPFTLVMVQMNSETVRAVEGMPIRTIQWETHGGLALNFIVMTICVPDIRAQYVGTSQSTRKVGIVHGTTS